MASKKAREMMDSVGCPSCGSPAIPMPGGKQWFCYCGLGAFTPKLPYCDWCNTPILGEVTKRGAGIRWDWGKYHLSCFREYYDEVEVPYAHALLEMIDNSEALACLFHCGDNHIEAYPDRDDEAFICPECGQELDWDEMWMKINTVRGIRVMA